MNFRSIAFAGAMMLVGPAVAALTVEEKGGAFAILQDGKTLVDAVSVDVGDLGVAEVRRNFVVGADGAKVWNRWCEDRAHRFRLEVVERPDGAVEMSLLGEVEAPYAERNRRLELHVPAAAMDGRRYDLLQGDGRKFRRESGTFATNMPELRGRWISTDKIVFDFNPDGPGNYASGYTSRALNGVWNVRPDGARGGYLLGGGGTIKQAFGGFVGTKVVVSEGSIADYPRFHFLRQLTYRDHLDAARAAVRRFAFGAPAFGGGFAAGDIPFDASKGFGWTEDVPRRTNVGHKEGAYYSNVAGSGPATYRVGGLPDGFYIVTLHLGNWTGAANRFRAAVNGVTLGSEIEVGPRKARTLSRAVRITGGRADFAFAGDWLVSGISLQPLMSDREDFTVNRAFWSVAGYEPATLYRTEDVASRPEFPVADETIDMPPPGEENKGPCGQARTPVELPDMDAPSLRWLRDTRTYKLLDPDSSLAELADPQVLRDFLDRELAGRAYTSAMVNGMHGRFAYGERQMRRGTEAFRRICEEMHRRGIRVFDHNDVTMLWNLPYGFRTLMERLPEAMRGTSDYLPSIQLCPNNRAFAKRAMRYLKDQVEAGVDGFQIDELEFWEHGCQCAQCRRDFHRDTGWWMPLNECHPALAGFRDPLAKALFDWRMRKITNWYVVLRRFLKDVKPDLALSAYSTHWGYTRSLPRYHASSSITDLGRVMNYFGTEVMPRDPMACARSMLPFRRMANMFVLAADVPIWGWYYPPDGPSGYFCWAVANLCGQTAMLGDATDRTGVPDYSSWSTSSANMTRLGSATVAKTALLFSTSSRDWNPVAAFHAELFGAAQELERMHVPYDVLGDMNLDEAHLAKYEVLVLGESECLSDAQVAAIRAFAERGGTVVLSAATGLFDALGERRRPAAFGDVTGYDPSGAAKAEPCAADEVPDCRVTAFGRGRFAYFPKLAAARFYQPEIDVGQKWDFAPDPSAVAAFRKILSDLIGEAAWWRTDAPEGMFAGLWHQADGAIAVHLLNATGIAPAVGDAVKGRAPSPAFPPLVRDVTFDLPADGDVRAEATRPEFAGARALQVRRVRDGWVRVTVPRDLFRAYLLVRVRFVK